MKKTSLVAVPALVLTLLTAATPVHATAATPAPSPSTSASAPRHPHDAAPPPTGSTGDANLSAWVEQFIADPLQFDQFLEEDCLEDNGPACTMSAADVARIPADVQTLVTSLVKEVTDDPTLVTGAGATTAGGIQPDIGGGALIRAIGNVAKSSSNKLVQKLQNNADRIADFADGATIANNAATGLVAGTAVAVSKAVVYSMPVFGDVFSLAENIDAGNIEGAIVAGISLIGTAVAIAFPPAGAVIAAATAIYSVVKSIIGWIFGGSSAELAVAPPPTPQEMIDQGAEVQWVTRHVNDIDAAVVIPRAATSVTQTLLLDSKWTEYNTKTKPVTYAIKKIEDFGGYEYWGGDGFNILTGVYPTGAITFQAWQFGKQYTGKCLVNTNVTVIGAAPNASELMCGPDSDITIALNQPAVIRLTYDYGSRACPKDPPTGFLSLYDTCTKPSGTLWSDLSVHTVADNQIHQVRLPINFSWAITD